MVTLVAVETVVTVVTVVAVVTLVTVPPCGCFWELCYLIVLVAQGHRSQPCSLLLGVSHLE